jgi:hypothetical protein
MKPVVIESPYGSDDPKIVKRNEAYLQFCMHDCLVNRDEGRGEAPYASHGLYTQPFVLDDNDPGEHAAGIQAGFVVAEALHTQGAHRAFYVDLGHSTGMRYGKEHALKIGQDFEERYLPNDLRFKFADLCARKGWPCPKLGRIEVWT